MNKFYIVPLLIIFSFSSFSAETIKLKERIYTEEKSVFLCDLIENRDNFIILKNIVLKDIVSFPHKITTDEIINILFDNNIFNIAIIGESCTIYNQQTNTADFVGEIYSHHSPISDLENHLFSFINNNNISLKIKLIKTEPQINLENINTDYSWDFPKATYNINEIQKLNKLPVFINNKKYTIFFETELSGGVWIAKQHLFKNDFLNKGGFKYKIVDFSKEKKISSLVFDINQAINTKLINNINIGDVLYWDNLKKNPLIQKGELTKLILKKNNFEIILPCTALNDGYENERIKIRLTNGREILGKLRKEANGVNYVEL